MNADATVFSVDTNFEAQESLQWFLWVSGFNVTTFSSAGEFLDCYDSAKLACLVLEMHMPGMDGLELQNELVSRGQRIPIIFVTGTSDIPSCVRAIRAGAIGVLEKPVEYDSLLPLLQHALEEDRQRRERELETASIASRLEKLTGRERDVMELLYVGKPMKAIASVLKISHQTVAKHRHRVLAKMKVESDAELIRLIVANRLPSLVGGESVGGVLQLQEPPSEESRAYPTERAGVGRPLALSSFR